MLVDAESKKDVSFSASRSIFCYEILAIFGKSVIYTELPSLQVYEIIENDSLNFVTSGSIGQ